MQMECENVRTARVVSLTMLVSLAILAVRDVNDSQLSISQSSFRQIEGYEPGRWPYVVVLGQN